MKIVDQNQDFIFDNSRSYTWKYYLKCAYHGILDRYYSLHYRFSNLKVEDKKYNVSICAIFKNEAPYFREWIEFHKIIGIDHFYLYNNLSEDDYIEVLKPYIQDGTVEIIQWPYPQKQMEAYADFISKYASETKWVGFIDIDEFIIPRSDHNIYDFLKRFEKYPAVLMYWRLYGSSGLMKRNMKGLITEDFTVAWPKLDEVGKCFFNTAYELDPNFKQNATFHHYVWGRRENRYYPPVNIAGYVCSSRQRDKLYKHEIPIQINHYFTKSYEEYIIKKSKGDVFFKTNPHDTEYFFRHEMKCTKVDHSAYKYLIKLKHAMGMEE